QARGVVVVMVGDEDRADVAHVQSGLRDPTRGAVTGIDDVERTVDDEQGRRLRAMWARWRARNRAERDEAGAGAACRAGALRRRGFQGGGDAGGGPDGDGGRRE